MLPAADDVKYSRHNLLIIQTTCMTLMPVGLAMVGNMTTRPSPMGSSRQRAVLKARESPWSVCH